MEPRAALSPLDHTRARGRAALRGLAPAELPRQPDLGARRTLRPDEDRLTAIAVELLVSGEIQYRESVQRAHEWRIERKRQIEQQRRSAYRARDQRHSFILVTGADAEPILTPWSLLRAR